MLQYHTFCSRFFAIKFHFNFIVLHNFNHFIFVFLWYNRETPVVEKEVEENDVPKVVEAEEKSVENGKDEDVAAVPTKNGEVPAVEEEEDESKDGDEEKNGDSTGKLEHKKRIKFSVEFQPKLLIDLRLNKFASNAPPKSM